MGASFPRKILRKEILEGALVFIDSNIGKKMFKKKLGSKKEMDGIDNFLFNMKLTNHINESDLTKMIFENTFSNVYLLHGAYENLKKYSQNVNKELAHKVLTPVKAREMIGIRKKSK